MNKSPQRIAKRVIELHGGYEEFSRTTRERLGEFNALWQQDTEHIGRVLRAHLVVEHYIEEYLKAKNPRLGALEDARLGFNQKLELLDDENLMVSLLKPGLRRLNKIRNRLAHTLTPEVTDADKEAFLSVELFRDVRDEHEKHEGVQPNDPLSVMEQFALFAAGVLQAGAEPEFELWRQAFEEK